MIKEMKTAESIWNQANWKLVMVCASQLAATFPPDFIIINWDLNLHLLNFYDISSYR